MPVADSVKAGVAFVESEYRIAPQDTLEITVYQFQNLSRVVQVDGAGRVSLPLVGAIIAAGRTVADLETEIARRLGAKYIQSPQVSVLVKELSARASPSTARSACPASIRSRAAPP